MGTLKSILCLLPLVLSAKANSYFTQKSCKPSPTTDGTCKYFEPAIKTRINSQTCYPEVTQDEAQAVASKGHPSFFEPRSHIFFADPEKPRATFGNKNINFGFLPLNEDIKSIGDLLDLSSDEIGLPARTAPPRSSVKLWNIDEVKSFTPPELLPDVVLDSDQKTVSNKQQNPNYAIDPEQIKLGRFIVADDPPEEEPVRVIDKTQQFDSNASYKLQVPEVILEDVMPQEDKEPDFMEQLEKIKLAAKTTKPLIFTEDLVKVAIEESVTEPSYVEEPVAITIPSVEFDTNDKNSEAEAEASTSKNNAIEKEYHQKSYHFSKEKSQSLRKHKKHHEHHDHNQHESEHTTEAPVFQHFHPTYEPVIQDATVKHFGTEETVLDELLSVV